MFESGGETFTGIVFILFTISNWNIFFIFIQGPDLLVQSVGYDQRLATNHPRIIRKRGEL